MNKLGRLILVFLMLVNNTNSYAQESPIEIPKSTELSIPASPAFQMLDASSSLVSTPGAIRDFKVDWSFKSYRLSPNLAIEAQPVWAVFYNRPTPEKYQNAGKFLQSLSTLNISAGSLDFNDSIRLFSYAGKITLYRRYDPLVTNKFSFQDLQDDFKAQQALLDSDFIQLKQQFLLASTRDEKDSLERLVYAKADERDALKANQKQRMQQRLEELKGRYWNATSIDFAAGRSFSFNRFTSERIDSIKFEQRSNVCWLNAGIGIGRKWLLTAQIRCEFLKVTLPDSNNIVLTDSIFDFDGTFLETSQRDSLAITFDPGEEWIFSYGLNLRYGSPRYNFFVEGFYTKNRIPTFEEVKWTFENGARKKKTSIIKEEFIFAFGGEWKISNSVVLSYGIRCVLNEKDKNIQLRQVIPIASISCLMR
ncbi:MAG: hypothetical protein IPG90_06585 [Bacteroidetes bacterium]|nr:hypothetical protein [Bacteroidota bacterium]MBK6837966.1 hypothetical protein [Bacteroidota bacterium]